MVVKRRAYVTLLTRPNYLAGVIILAYTLRMNSFDTGYPLVVLYTQSLPNSSVRALELEASRTNIILRKITPLLPPSKQPITLIAERFADTWTKLRVFELYDLSYDEICYLDADMMICRNMDSVFDTQLPGKDWIGACHGCICNCDSDPWAAPYKSPENCVYTQESHPCALSRATPVQENNRPDAPPQHINSGMFLFHPSKRLWEEMLEFFSTTPLLSTFQFPDQDFLEHFFRNRRIAIPWQYNALKTSRYWHTNIWRDDEVICLHYIVDKPWANRIQPNGVAGYKGRDGVTHSWWWAAYESWVNDRQDQEVVHLVSEHVASSGGELEEMKAIGSDVQGFAHNQTRKQTENGLDSSSSKSTDSRAR
ncbi:MAG: hypothetical protein M1820_009237 [Bogoriella megaspora]|nr:MAG: hypothetical protein M1820_009237 [Bogoriella megaspora]